MAYIFKYGYQHIHFSPCKLSIVEKKKINFDRTFLYHNCLIYLNVKKKTKKLHFNS